MKKYIKENKKLLIKYSLIIVSNILLVILNNFYLKNNNYKNMILLFIIVVSDLIICNYKEKVEFKWYLDLIFNFIIGLILMFITNNIIDYSIILLSLYLATNIIFVRSRYSDKFSKRILQYIMIFIYTILIMFINIFMYMIFK